LVGAATVAALYLFQILSGGLAAEIALGMALLLSGLLLWQCCLLGAGAALGARPTLLAIQALFILTLVPLTWSALSWPPPFGSGRPQSLDPSATIVEIILLLSLASVFLLGVIVGASDAAVSFVVRLLIGGGGAFALWAIWLMASGQTPQAPPGRVAANYFTPNTAGTVFAALLLLAVFQVMQRLRWALNGRSWWPVALWALPALILGAALMLTASRGAIAACAVGFLVMLAAQWRLSAGSLSARVAAGLMAIALIGVGVAFGRSAMSRLLTTHADADARGQLFALHWKIFLDDPVRGHGLGTFDLLNRLHLTADNFALLWPMRAAHNLYLQWIEEAGLIGAAPMAVTVGLILTATLIGAVRRRSAANLLWTFIAVDLVFLLHGMADFALQTPSVAALWTFLLGLQAAVALRPREDASNQLRRAPLQGAFALLVGALAALALGSLLNGGAVQIAGAELMPLTAGYDRHAKQLLSDADGPPDLNAARAATLRAIALSPHDTSAMARLAYIDVLAHGRLTPTGLAQFRRSYDLVPLDQSIAIWRIRFALENWQALDSTTRVKVRDEFDALLSTGRYRQALLEMLSSVRNQRGAFVATFWATQVRRSGR
jgi:O-antigen ligase